MIRHNMGCSLSLPRNILIMRKTIGRLLILCFVITTLLSISSYSHHSSLGIDHDFEQQDRILHKYYRLNWTGYGSILIGYGSQWKQKQVGKALEKFDLALSLLKPAETPADRNTIGKRLGFWFIKSESPTPMLWVGFPSWLPVLLLLLLLLVYFKRSNIARA